MHSLPSPIIKATRKTLSLPSHARMGRFLPREVRDLEVDDKISDTRCLFARPDHGEERQRVPRRVGDLAEVPIATLIHLQFITVTSSVFLYSFFFLSFIRLRE